MRGLGKPLSPATDRISGAGPGAAGRSSAYAWLQNFRRLVTRWEYHADNFLGFVQFGCIAILLRHL